MISPEEVKRKAEKWYKEAQKINRLVNSSLGRFMYLNMNISPKLLLKKGFADKKSLSKVVHQHYIQAFPDKDSRISLLNLAKELVGSSDWYQKQWEQLDLLANKKWLILWGTEDAFITRDYLMKWQEKLPNATVRELESGHFVQEEAKEESIQAIRIFIQD